MTGQGTYHDYLRGLYREHLARARDSRPGPVTVDIRFEQVAQLLDEYDAAAHPATPIYLVTVKREPSADHDPRNKQTGACVMSPECTDVTGEHHTGVADHDHMIELVNGPLHVTRVERVRMPGDPA